MLLLSFDTNDIASIGSIPCIYYVQCEQTKIEVPPYMHAGSALCS